MKLSPGRRERWEEAVFSLGGLCGLFVVCFLGGWEGGLGLFGVFFPYTTLLLTGNKLNYSQS